MPFYFKNHPWIKICGITDPGTAAACARMGADAIGLVFFNKSPRNVTFHQAADITAALPQKVLPVGVFVNATFEFIFKAMSTCGIRAAQLHGHESPTLIDRLKDHQLVVIKALFANKEPCIDQAKTYGQADFLLVECGKGKLPGGNALAWDYSLIGDRKNKYAIVLAGGLTVSSVSSAIQEVRPCAVDVSSGVETAPGIKDLHKVKQFIKAVRQTPAQTNG